MLIDSKFRQDLELNIQLAESRLEDLRLQVEEWEDNYFLPFHREDRDNCVVFVADETPLPPPYFSALLSEALHHLTLGFEHIAWRLVSEEAKGNKDAVFKIGMPVVLQSDKWGGELAKRLPGIDPKYVPAVKKIQPFTRAKLSGASSAEYNTVILRDFDNAVKHRGHHIMHAQLSKVVEITEVIPPVENSTPIEITQRSVGYLAEGDELLRIHNFGTDRVVHVSLPSFRTFVVSSGEVRMDEKGIKMLGFPFEQLGRMVRDLRNTLEGLLRDIDAVDMK